MQPSTPRFRYRYSDILSVGNTLPELSFPLSPHWDFYNLPHSMPNCSSPHPLVGAPAPGEHEDVIHLPLALLLLQLSPLVLWDDVIPVSDILVLQLWGALLHTGEIGHLPSFSQRWRRSGGRFERAERRHGI